MVAVETEQLARCTHGVVDGFEPEPRQAHPVVQVIAADALDAKGVVATARLHYAQARCVRHQIV
jgi:hypothetical protein